MSGMMSFLVDIRNAIALLIIDVQVNMFDEKFCVYDADRILDTLQVLASRARSDDAPVIYLRYNGSSGDPDEPHTPGWEIHPTIAPQAGDWIIDKTTPDAFVNTELQDLLDNLGSQTVVLAGMQTEVCIAATGNTAVARGYEVIIVADSHTTFDFPEMLAVDAITQLNTEMSSLAQVLPAEEVSFKV